MNLHEMFFVSSKSGDSPKNYRHIDTINVTDSYVAILKRTQEPDGTPYRFKKILIKVSIPMSSSTSAARINLNSTNTICYRSDMVSSNNSTLTTVKAEIDGGLIHGFMLNANSADEYSTPLYKGSLMFDNHECIHTVTAFMDATSTYFPIGSSVEIYGIDL